MCERETSDHVECDNKMLVVVIHTIFNFLWLDWKFYCDEVRVPQLSICLSRISVIKWLNELIFGVWEKEIYETLIIDLERESLIISHEKVFEVLISTTH